MDRETLRAASVHFSPSILKERSGEMDCFVRRPFYKVVFIIGRPDGAYALCLSF